MKKSVQILIFAFIGVVTVNTAKAQTYDPLAVQRINDLIANNGLKATPNAPETWTFATWNDENPKKIIVLNFQNIEMGGHVSFVGLITLQTLYCNRTHDLTGIINELDVTNCMQLKVLDCSGMGPLYKLYLINCTQLQTLKCRDNYLTELDLSDCIQLQMLDCEYCSLIELDVTNCIQLQTLNCKSNHLTKLDLTGLDKLANFNGGGQGIRLTLYQNETDEYTCAILLNNPTFESSAISYSEGILKSIDNTVAYVAFTVQTDDAHFALSGTLNLVYSNVGIQTQEKGQLKVYPNPTTGVLQVTSDELQVTNIEIFDIMGKNVSCRISHIVHPISIDISHFPSGIYFVKITTDTGIIVKKVVKQ